MASSTEPRVPSPAQQKRHLVLRCASAGTFLLLGPLKRESISRIEMAVPVLIVVFINVLQQASLVLQRWCIKKCRGSV